MNNAKKESNSAKIRPNLFSLVYVVVLMICHTVVAAAGVDEFLAYKRGILAPLGVKFKRICKAQIHDSAMRRFQERLALIDEVAKLLIDRVEHTNLTVLGGVLDDIIEASKGGFDSRSKTSTPEACDIYAQFINRFSAELPTPDIAEKDLTLLREYYNAAIAATEKYLMEHGKAAKAIADSAEREVVELYVVMSFLHIPDRQWSSHEIDSFPSWMRKSKQQSILEEFSLSVGRPFTAAEFAQYGKGESWDPKQELHYFGAKARQFTSTGKYKLAILCYKAAIEAAVKEGHEEDAMRVHISLARLYERMGYPKLVASTLKEALHEYPKSSEWGKAAMLRLKYLYEAEEFQEILKEAQGYQIDSRCKTYLPQILYIAWITYRRENKREMEAKVQEFFLKKFPTHPLAADIYFASAMLSLAGGDYAEAMRLLEVVEYRFPHSRIIDKVKMIQEKLRKGLIGQGDERAK